MPMMIGCVRSLVPADASVGRAADLVGRRRMFVTGLGVFAAASFASAMAGTAGALFAARADQGLGAAMLSPAALAIIMTAFQREPADEKPSPPGEQSEAQALPSASSSAVSSPSSATGG
jgi:MFS family permease